MQGDWCDTMKMMDSNAATRLLDWALSISPSSDAHPRALCDVVQRVVGPSAGVSVILWDHNNDRFTRSVSTIPGQPEDFGVRHVRTGVGTTAAIVHERRIVHCPRVSATIERENPMLREHQIESYVGAPIMHADHAIGAIYLLYRQPEHATGDEVELLGRLAAASAGSLAPISGVGAATARPEPRAPEMNPKASVWDAIVNDPVTGSALIDEDGVVRMWTPTMARHWGVEPECPSRMEAFLPHATASTLASLVEQCRTSGQTTGITGLHLGRPQVTVCRLVRERPDACDRFWLSTFRPDEFRDAPAPLRALSTRESSLGVFETLTRRELEVLALLGEGMGLHEIAARLHRSRKTIDNHRRSIGVKLGARNLPELIMIASRSGLRIDDVSAGARKPAAG